MTQYGIGFNTMVHLLLFCPMPAVNGLAMSVASLFKAVGPSISGALFSWSLTNGNVQEIETEFFCFVSVCVSCVFGTRTWFSTGFSVCFRDGCNTGYTLLLNNLVATSHTWSAHHTCVRIDWCRYAALDSLPAIFSLHVGHGRLNLVAYFSWMVSISMMRWCISATTAAVREFWGSM